MPPRPRPTSAEIDARRQSWREARRQAPLNPRQIRAQREEEERRALQLETDQDNVRIQLDARGRRPPPVPPGRRPSTPLGIRPTLGELPDGGERRRSPRRHAYSPRRQRRTFERRSPGLPPNPLTNISPGSGLGTGARRGSPFTIPEGGPISSDASRAYMNPATYIRFPGTEGTIPQRGLGIPPRPPVDRDGGIGIHIPPGSAPQGEGRHIPPTPRADRRGGLFRPPPGTSDGDYNSTLIHSNPQAGTRANKTQLENAITSLTIFYNEIRGNNHEDVNDIETAFEIGYPTVEGFKGIQVSNDGKSVTYDEDKCMSKIMKGGWTENGVCAIVACDIAHTIKELRRVITDLGPCDNCISEFVLTSELDEMVSNLERVKKLNCLKV